MREHPALVVLGALAAVATILTFVFTVVLDGDGVVLPELGLGFCDDPQLSLSDGSGPSGTQLVVSGSGFPRQRSVRLRFHTEALAPARTDDDGDFQTAARIPGTFDAFAPQQFSITATADACSQRAPFQLER